MLIIILVIALVAWNSRKTASGSTNLPSSAPSIAGIQCNSSEQLTYHQHAKLDVFIHGKLYQIPPFIGIPQTANCFYWMHTHTLSQYAQGVIHMEFPATPPRPTPTLKRFLLVWQKTRPDQDAPVAAILKGGPQIRYWIDRKPYSGTLDSIKLHPHELVTVEVGKPLVPPAKFTFPAGL